MRWWWLVIGVMHAADTFNSIDTNSDGVIDRAELDSALESGQLQLATTGAQVNAQACLLLSDRAVGYI